MRVFPNPRPAKISHVSHGFPFAAFFGGSCVGRAQNFQSHRSASYFSVESSRRIFSRAFSGSEASNAAADELCCVAVFMLVLYGAASKASMLHSRELGISELHEIVRYGRGRL